MSSKRRDFLRNTILTGIGASLSPLAATASTVATTVSGNDSTPLPDSEAPRSGTLTLLQTTDVHCQIHPHDEMFWENGRMVFRKTAGYGQLATMLDKIRKQNPNTFTVDTGDMFQGSELSVKTNGKAFVPILDAIGYDLYLPGNWEVIYGKKPCKPCSEASRRQKCAPICTTTSAMAKKAISFFRPIIRGRNWV